MVPPASHRVSRVPWYSGYCSGLLVFVYWAFTIFGMLSQNISTNNLPSLDAVRNPEELGSSVWPVAISLAATLAIEFSFFSYCYLDVSVRSVRFIILSFQIMMTLRPGFPIRISQDQCLFITPLSFSQCITSFIASDCQGIHQMPLPIA